MTTSQQNLGAEIDHLLSFNWPTEQIVAKLGCHRSTVEKRKARQRDALDESIRYYGQPCERRRG